MNWSSSFKQLILGLSIVCIITSLGIYLANSDDPGVTMNFGRYSQGEASFILALIGILLINAYYAGARLFKSNYEPDPSKKSTKDTWLQ